MLTLGDVLAVVALTFGSALALGALCFCFGYAFPGAVARTARRVEARPSGSFFLGLGASLPIVLLGVVLLSLPNPLSKAAGTLLLAGFALALVFGAAGVAFVLTQRVQAHPSALPKPGASLMACMALSTAFVLPFVGPFLVAPVVCVAGFGAWLGSRRARVAVAAEGPA
jgi:hypothetical protein